MSRQDKKRQKRKKMLEQRRKQATRARQEVSVAMRWVRNDTDQIVREIDYIVAQAEAGSTRVVTLGALVLFSTETGDAWMLDAEDAYALCLARDGERRPVDVVDTGPAYQIEWPSRFAIDGESFVVTDNSGRLRAIIGYPTEAIEAHCRLAVGDSSGGMRATGSSSTAAPINWDLAFRGVPTEDVLEGLNLSNPGDLDEAVRTFCAMLEDGSFALWEAVIREEQGLPQSQHAAARLDYEYVCVDVQHGLHDFSDVTAMLVAVAAGTATPLVRTPWN